jgi:Zn-dependent protease with chaperone function
MQYLGVLILSYSFWQWMSLYLYTTSIKAGKTIVEKIKDKTLLEMVFRKTGLQLESIRISSSSKPWGMMIGLPKYPYMIVSRALYEGFNADEVEYVILHETGHYLLGHSAKLAVLYLSFLSMGFVLMDNLTISFLWIVIAIAIGLIQIQMSRILEYEADTFALKYMSNPQGMITATHKFQKAYARFDVIRHDEDTFLGRLIYMGIPYNERVRNAEREVNRRGK